MFYHITGGIGNNSQGAHLVVSQVIGGPGGGHGHGHAAVGVLEPHKEEEVVGAVVHGQKLGQALPDIFFGDGSGNILWGRRWALLGTSNCPGRS